MSRIGLHDLVGIFEVRALTYTRWCPDIFVFLGKKFQCLLFEWMPAQGDIARINDLHKGERESPCSWLGATGE